MKILAFDTCNSTCSSALIIDGKVVGSRVETRPSRQAETLLVQIQELLDEQKIGYQDLDYIALTTGPGSFTGIRIGLAAAKGIELATGVKLIYISCMQAALCMLTNIGDYEQIMVINNASRGEVYFQVFDNKYGAISELELLSLDEAIKRKEAFDGGVVAMGVETISPNFPYLSAELFHRLLEQKHLASLQNEISYVRPALSQ